MQSFRMSSGNYFKSLSPEDPIGTEENFHHEVILDAAAWGWNSNHRAGHLTATQLVEPHHIQRSKFHNYVSISAGKHHSLLVSDQGIVYSFGDGRKGQLGYGNVFTGEAVKGGIVQGIPKPITPSGLLKFGRDIQCVEVAAGGSFSIAREACPAEGARRVVGFLSLEDKLKLKLDIFPESTSLRKAWSMVRQERFAINRISEGGLVVWGEGNKGELGLGGEKTYSPYPQPLLSLQHTCITSISAGERHVLAIDRGGRLFSWGSGGGGRLGHGDYCDRAVPEVVKFFSSMIVTQCSAGDAHSAVLTIGRGVPGRQSPRILTFGRGAHGRLGGGTNRNCHTPLLVSSLPDSVEGGEIVQVVCGGAHTLALGREGVEGRRLAFPFEERSFVLAWGYGANGQLGTGGRGDSFLPVRVRLPKAEVVVEVAAGRSWSMARSVGGKLYTWGKGLRGQLGQGTEHSFSLSPREISTFMSFLKLSGGYAHSLALFTSKTRLSLPFMERLHQSEEGKREKERVDVFAYSNDRYLSLAPLRCRSLYEVNCCHRVSLLDYTPRPSPSLSANPPAPTAFQSSSSVLSISSPHSASFPSFRESLRFDCLTCQVKYCCYYCARLCHAGHKVTFSKLKVAKDGRRGSKEVGSRAAGGPEGGTAGVEENKERTLGERYLEERRRGMMRAEERRRASLSSSPKKIRRTTVARGEKEGPEIGNPLNVPPPPHYSSDLPPLPGPVLFPLSLLSPLPYNMRNSNNGYHNAEEARLSFKYFETCPPAKFSCYDSLVNKIVNFTEEFKKERQKREAGRKGKKKKGLLGTTPSPIRGNAGPPSLSSSLLPPGLLPTSISTTSTDPPTSTPDGKLTPSGKVTPSRARLRGLTPKASRTPTAAPPAPAPVPPPETAPLPAPAPAPAPLVSLNPFALGGHRQGELLPTCHCSLYCGSEGRGGRGRKEEGGKCLLLPNLPESFEEMEEEKEKEKKLGRSMKGGKGSLKLKTEKLRHAPSLLGGLSLKLPSMPSLPSLPSLSSLSFRKPRSTKAGTGGGEVKEGGESNGMEWKRARVVQGEVSDALSNLDTLHSNPLQIQRNVFFYYNGYAGRIARWMKKIVTRRRYELMVQRMLTIRHEVVSAHVSNNIIQPIFAKFKRVYASYREREEREAMKGEEERMEAFNHHAQQQRLLMAMRMQRLGVEFLLMRGSIHYPVKKRHFLRLFPDSFPLVGEGGEVGKKSDFFKSLLFSHETSPSSSYLLLPSYSFSLSSLRQQQLLLHPSQRLPSTLLVKLTRSYPYGGDGREEVFAGGEREIYENFLRNFVISQQSLRERVKRMRAQQQQKLVAQQALQRLKAMGGGGGAGGPGAAVAPGRVYRGGNLAAYKQHVLNLTKQHNRVIKQGYKNTFREELKLFAQCNNSLLHYHLLHTLSLFLLEGKARAGAGADAGREKKGVKWEKRREGGERGLEEKKRGEKGEVSHPFHLPPSLSYALHADLLSLLNSLPSLSSVPSTAPYLAAQLVLKYHPLLLQAGQRQGQGGKEEKKGDKNGETHGVGVEKGEKKKGEKEKGKGKVFSHSAPHDHTPLYTPPSTLSPLLSNEQPPSSLPPTRRRRHSLSNPSQLYQRIVKTCLSTIPRNAFLRRRFSEPPVLKRMEKVEFLKSREMQNSLSDSLSLFALRKDTIVSLLEEYRTYYEEVERGVLAELFPSLSPDGSKKRRPSSRGGSLSSTAAREAAEREGKGVQNAKGAYLYQMYFQTVIPFSPFSPRYPPDIYSLLLSPERRRTIAEPERLYSHLQLLTTLHTSYAEIVNFTNTHVYHTHKDNNRVYRHKRSFDYGENYNDARGIMDSMDFGFEHYVHNSEVFYDQVFNKRVYADPHYTGGEGGRRGGIRGGDDFRIGRGTENLPSIGGGGYYHALDKSSKQYQAHLSKVSPFIAESQRLSQRITQQMIAKRLTDTTEEVRAIARERLSVKKNAFLQYSALESQKTFLMEREIDPSPLIKDLQRQLQRDQAGGGEGSVKSGGSSSRRGGGGRRARKSNKQKVKDMARRGGSNPFDDETPSLFSQSIAEGEDEEGGEEGEWGRECGEGEGGDDEGEGESLLSSLPSQSLSSYHPPLVVQTYYTEGGEEYFFDPRTGRSFWSLSEVPAPAGGQVQVETPYVDEYGNAYWYNAHTQEYRAMEQT